MAITIGDRGMQTVADTSMFPLSLFHFMWGNLTSSTEGTLITCGNIVKITHTDTALTFTNFGTTTDGIWTWDITSEYSSDINEIIILHWSGLDSVDPSLWINGVAKEAGTETQTPNGGRAMSTSASWYLGSTATNGSRLKGDLYEADIVSWDFADYAFSSELLKRITKNHILGQLQRYRPQPSSYTSTPNKHWNFARIANDGRTAYSRTNYTGAEATYNHINDELSATWNNVVGATDQIEALQDMSDTSYIEAKRTSSYNDSGDVNVNTINQNIVDEIPAGGWITSLNTSYRRRSLDGNSFNTRWRLDGLFSGFTDVLSSNMSSTSWTTTSLSEAISRSREAIKTAFLLNTAPTLDKGEAVQVAYAPLYLNWTRKLIRSNGMGREVVGGFTGSDATSTSGRPKLARAL